MCWWADRKSAVSELAGKRIVGGELGNCSAYEVRVLIDKIHLGANTIIVPLNRPTMVHSHATGDDRCHRGGRVVRLEGRRDGIATASADRSKYCRSASPVGYQRRKDRDSGRQEMVELLKATVKD